MFNKEPMNVKNDDKNSGWRPIATWQFAVGGFIIVFLTSLDRIEELGYFRVLELFSIYLVIALISSLAFCLIVYLKYSRNLDASIEKLKHLETILKIEELQNERDKGKWLIPNEKVKENERSDKVIENWTLTSDFYYELNDFKEIVLDNFKKNITSKSKTTKYRYIYPNTDEANQQLNDFRRLVVKEIGGKIRGKPKKVTLFQLNQHVKLFPLNENIVPLNEGIHNPHEPDKMGLLMTPEESFKYYISLNKIQTGALVIKFEHLCELSKRETAKEIEFLSMDLIEENLK